MKNIRVVEIVPDIRSADNPLGYPESTCKQQCLLYAEWICNILLKGSVHAPSTDGIGRCVKIAEFTEQKMKALDRYKVLYSGIKQVKLK